MNNKVYEVNFGTFEENEEALNVDRRTVLAINVEEAIKEAKQLLTNEESKTYFVESVILQVKSIDNA